MEVEMEQALLCVLQEGLLVYVLALLLALYDIVSGWECGREMRKF